MRKEVIFDRNEMVWLIGDLARRIFDDLGIIKDFYDNSPRYLIVWAKTQNTQEEGKNLINFGEPVYE